MFGEITSCVVKAPKANPATANSSSSTEAPKVTTHMGFINFKVKEDAHEALVKGPKATTIQDLYENGQVYLNFHIKRD
jgi:hypothetical protein